MGLQEDREIKSAQEKWLPSRQKELKELCGGEIPYEIDWKSFDGDVKGLQWLENNGPAIVARGFRIVCKDDLGKEAVRKAVKKVVLKNVADPKDKKMAFEKGILTLHCAFAKSPGGRFAENEVGHCLEKGL